VPVAAANAVRVRRESRFIWPAVADVTSFFGPGHPSGIDIGIDPGTPIRASAEGVVTSAGGNSCCELGLYVVVEHGAGYSTLYGHLSEILVTQGRQVQQGEVLGLGGSTGETDGTHLHFEIREEGRPVDPFHFLRRLDGPSFDGSQLMTCSQAIEIAPASLVTLDLSFDPGRAGYTLQDVSLRNLLGTPGVGLPVVRTDNLQALIEVPAVSVTTGRTVHFEFRGTLVKDQERQSLLCNLELRTNETLINSENTIARLRAEAAAEAAAEAESEAAAEEAAATPTPASGGTAAAIPTATPARSGPPQAATFTQPQAATFTPPKPATFSPPTPVTRSAPAGNSTPVPR
jgi:hypothetical protein